MRCCLPPSATCRSGVTDLGERELNIFVDLFEKKATRVAVMGSDIPSVPLAYLRSAFHLLKSPGCDAVLGPSRDGGYYCIGAQAGRAGLPALFENIEWSTEKVMQQTLRQARLHNLNVRLIPRWYDVDTVEDMRKLAEQLRRKHRMKRIPHGGILKRL